MWYVAFGIKNKTFFKKLVSNDFIILSKIPNKYFCTYNFNRYLKKIQRFVDNKEIDKIPDELLFKVNKDF